MTAEPLPGPAYAVAAARTAFPCGLSQPPRGQGFRFGTDSLQLAAFAAPRPKERILDLGCGCGVIGLACLLRSEAATLAGIDRDQDMLDHARRNAELLGFSDRAAFHQADLRGLSGSDAARLGRFSLVLANPPYRLAQSGRESRSATKRAACFDPDNVLAAFLKAGILFLGASGRMCVSGLTDRLDSLFSALAAVGLTPKRLRFLHGHARASSKIALVEAKPNARPGLVVEPPFFADAGPSRDAAPECA